MLYVILPVHNRASVTSRFLDALTLQSFVDYTLLLVDDGCTDDTVAIAQKKLPAEKLMVLAGDGQLWWAGALQLAYLHLAARSLAPSDTVLIINDDVTFEADFLANGLSVLDGQTDLCIQAMGVDRTSGAIDRGAIADVVRLRFRAAEPQEVANCLSTRGLLMNARTFLNSGGFRPRWLPHYLSDYEFTLRLQRRGTRLMVDERFKAQIDLELTGIGQPSPGSARRLWNDAFSNRAKFNPKHWTAFVVMACPPHVVPLHVARIWFGFARSLFLAGLPKATRVR